MEPSHLLPRLLLLLSIFPSIRVFTNEWPKCWSFGFSISSSSEYSGSISFRTDCFHLLAVQGTLRSLLQHHNLKASILRHSAFFMVQLSHLYIVKSLSCVHLFATPWTVDCQAPLSMGFFRQEYRSGLPFPSPGDLSDPGIKH